MTVLDPVIHYLLTCGRKQVTLHDVMLGADRPRRPVLRVLDKLAREGYLRQVADHRRPPGWMEYGPARRNPTWRIIGDLSDRPVKTRTLPACQRARIWKVIRAKRRFTKADLVITSGASPATVDEYVRALERAGYVRRTGRDGRRITYLLVRRDQVDYPKITGRAS